MKRKRIIGLLSLIVIVGAALAVALSVQGKPRSRHARCKPDGVYLFALETGEITTVTVISHGADANELTVLAEYGDADPTVFGMFPGADSKMNDVGRAVRTGKNTYSWTSLNHGTMQGDGFMGKSVYIWVSGGEFTFRDHCETMELLATFALFSAAQDGDHDGLPDKNEDPILCVANEIVGKRLPMIAPYPPTM